MCITQEKIHLIQDTELKMNLTEKAMSGVTGHLALARSAFLDIPFNPSCLFLSLLFAK